MRFHYWKDNKRGLNENLLVNVFGQPTLYSNCFCMVEKISNLTWGFQLDFLAISLEKKHIFLNIAI